MSNFNTVDRNDKIKNNVTNIDDSNYCTIKFGCCVLRTAGATKTCKDGRSSELESVRGRATNRALESSEMLNASIFLTGEITEINRTRIIIKILDGNMQIGENTYIVETGLARTIFRKFGWVAITGNATGSDGSLFRFHLEGMLHTERPGLVITGLAGPLANDENHYILRLMTRIERIV